MFTSKLVYYQNLRKYSGKNFSKQTNAKKWKGVVGLEIHAQIASKSKLFSGSQSDFGSPVNSNVSLFDCAIPGTLPVLNRKCVEAGVKTAAALDCRINSISMFDRKHYFYADLPSGYQITQQRAPLAQNGVLTFPVLSPNISKKTYQKTARLHQLQLEQDSGKSLHDEHEGHSLVDLNRAGVPLMELVFEPDLSDGEEAAALVKEIILILSRLGTCSCKMEEGALRVDANISVHKEGEPLGTRTEVKNIGSVRGVAQAVEYEINRQINILNTGERVHNETRSWDSTSKSTIAMRDKETLQDYRFMPEPNLPPLHLNVSGDLEIRRNLVDVLKIKNELPKLPKDTRMELKEIYQLNDESVIILVNEPVLLSYFTDIMAIKTTRKPKIIINLLINDLLTICNKNKISIEDCKISYINLGELADMLEVDVINLHLARLILQEMLTNPSESPMKIATTNNWKQITNAEDIAIICMEVLEKNTKMVKQYKEGKTKVLFAIAGEVAKIAEQKINMATVINILKKLLK